MKKTMINKIPLSFYLQKKIKKHNRDINKIYYYIVRELIDRYKLSFTEIKNIDYEVIDPNIDFKRTITKLIFEFWHNYHRVVIDVHKHYNDINKQFFVVVEINGELWYNTELEDNTSITFVIAKIIEECQI